MRSSRFGGPAGFEPAYVRSLASGALERKVEAAVARLSRCEVCPRNCRIDRLADQTKVCSTGRRARVSGHFAHFGEEDVLRGWAGSGTIFFSFCNLKCVFCQNHDTSQAGEGREVDADGLAEIMLELERRGCHNINFVTPEHVVPQVLEGVWVAARKGLRLPLVYNTSGYDSLESLRHVEDVVDIYMPDFKYWSRERSRTYLKAKDYPERARAAVAEMHRQVGLLQIGPDGLARRGVLVRHLVMPGALDETGEILRWIATALSPATYVNVMAQYHPDYRAAEYPEIARRITAAEYRTAIEHARAAGLTRLDARAATA
ncbi:MAG: radical SAM protein [bacterium]